MYFAEPMKSGQRIMWQDFKSKDCKNENSVLKHCPTDFDGILFVKCGQLIYDCQHGKDKHDSWKKTISKRKQEVTIRLYACQYYKLI